jgi:oxygen-independent coproporphyrinogen III oxidase
MTVAEEQGAVERARGRVEEFKRFQQLGMIPLHGDFFPSGVHYPPITMYKPTTEEEFFGSYTLPADGRLDIYIHIPFCIRRCLFCHYPSLYSASDAKKDEYLDALEKEMDLGLRRLGIDKVRIRSILIGGGTPTDLTPAQLKRFLEFFTARCDMSGCTQFNYDVDPATLVGPDGLERLRIMRDFGVDRLTIGAQSLDEAILRKMNRSHGAQAVLDSIENSRQLGYMVNIEFIFGHPGQTLENWVEVMQKAIATQVDEIQLYRLKVLPYGDQQGTIQKFRGIRPEEVPPPETAIHMKAIAIELLGMSGYHEYLRRVFTRNRKIYSHYAYNQCCNLQDELGFGLSAFSSLRDRFCLNVQFFDEYYKAIGSGRLPINRGIVRDRDQQIRWATVLPLKNHWIRKKVFQAVTGVPATEVFPERFAALKEYGLVKEDDATIRLTELGAFFADEVVEQFHSPDYIQFPAADYADGPLNPYRPGASKPPASERSGTPVSSD